MKEQILGAAGARELEALYRAHPADFTRAFPDAFAERPESAVLQAWRERLFFESPAGAEDRVVSPRWRARDIQLAVAVSLVAGTLAKLPHIFPHLNNERFYSRNLGGIVVGALIVYFCLQKSLRKTTAMAIMALLFGSLLYLNCLPGKANSQTIVLACVHLPFFLWSLLGVAFLGGAWRSMQGRMEYVRYNGELLVYTTIILIGGMVLTGLTFALFTLIGLNIEEWYVKNVVVYGAIASPVVATLLVDRMVGVRFKIAPLLAKVFTPLFLLTVVAYLLAMTVNHKSPFKDRDFLMAFNALLLVVLGLCVFSISERGPKASAGVADLMNIGLVSATLLIDLVALAAILFRLTSYGFTPNRVAVLVANLLVFRHLWGILYQYVRFARGRSSVGALDQWIVGYLPVYTTWSLIVAVVVPLVLRFR